MLGAPARVKAQQQMLAKQIVIELVPQGTLVERIRAGGCGLGGVLTPTGVGTIVEEGKQKGAAQRQDLPARDGSARGLRADSCIRCRSPG